jgi:hypothetical protein
MTPRDTWSPLLAQIRPASLELVTMVRQQDTAEARAEVIRDYINGTFLLSLPKQHRAQGLGMLLCGLALDFAEVLDATPDADEWFRKFALAIAVDQ